jgi:hypothetical protein
MPVAEGDASRLLPGAVSAESHAEPAERGAERPRSWALVRASSIAIVLLVQCVGSTPGEPFDDERLQRPEGERAVTWVGRALSLVGRHVERPAIRARLIGLTTDLVRLRNGVLAPFQPFFDLTATHQQWGLFITPKRECYRAAVDARRGGEWVELYRVLELDNDELAMLRYRRLRAIYNPNLKRGAGAQYPGFVTWLAQRLMGRHPDYDAVRVRMQRVLIGDPGQPTRVLQWDFEEARERPAERPAT